MWVKFVGNRSLLAIPIADLHKRYFVCSHHFKDEFFYSSKKQRLSPNAVPSES